MTDTVVYLHAGRWVHPVQREQLHAVPPGFQFAWSHPHLAHSAAGTPRILAESSSTSRLMERTKPLALRVLGYAGYVRRSHAKPGTDAALIHSTQYLLKRPQIPYVLDFEHAQVFTLFQRIALRRPWARHRLEGALLNPALSRLMPWSDAAGRSLLNAIDPEVATRLGRKMETVYQCTRPAVENPPTRKPGPLRLLFIGTKFFEKGAVEAIAAVRVLRMSHEVHLDLVSYVPPEWEVELRHELGITVHRPGAPDLVHRLYAESDVLVFPSHMDTYGVVVQEAMAYGVPVVAADQFAMPELIEDDVSGVLVAHENSLWGPDQLSNFDYLLPPPRQFTTALKSPSPAYVDAYCTALARIAEDRDLHSRLATGALERVKYGIFAVERRRDALRRIYSDALG